MDIEEFKREHLEKVKYWKFEEGSVMPSRMAWYNNYKKMQGEVKKIRAKLEDAKILTPQNDRIFLGKLLLEDHNGIAQAHMGKLDDKKFETLILDCDVLRAIESVIMKPSAETSEKLGRSIYAHNTSKGYPIKNNWVINNRVVAACTDEVSSIVTREKFSLIFNWLIAEGIIIEDYPDRCSFKIIDGKFKWEKEMKEREWYLENKYLMEKLYKIFAKENDTDKIFIIIYLWQKWDDEFFMDWEKIRKGNGQVIEPDKFLFRSI